MDRIDRCALVVLLLTGCPSDQGTASHGATGETGETDGPAGDTSGSTGETEASMCGELDPGGFAPQQPNVPADCDEVVDNCKKDVDRDAIPFACDNAPDVANGAQRDVDADLLGDVVDLCPVVASETQPDSDRDGIGNACDSCAQRLPELDDALEAAGVPYPLWVRALPNQQDSDADGIGDACDNCPLVPNCGDYGPDAPATVLDGITTDIAGCQADADLDGIGDACEGAQDGVAVGLVGFAAGDDLDQDGLANGDDVCPRLTVAPQACDDASACPADAACTEGRCNHADVDGDGVGNACDTCPSVANPEQVASKDAATADDPDVDFIGNACESDPLCVDFPNRRVLGFFDLAVDGYCCVQTWPSAATLVDPDGVPLADDCSMNDGPCRELPAKLRDRPGAGTLPPGCAELLELECRAQANEVTLGAVGGDLVALWDHACLLPPRDQDFDAIADECDRCPFAFDPDNSVYVDAEGREWPYDGKYCNGDYAIDTLDPANGCLPD